MNLRTLLLTAGLAVSLAGGTVAQTAVVSTTTTSHAGTITEFGTDAFSIRTESAPQPLRYSFSKTTTYVDEDGAPVSVDVVKTGAPVTVYYVREGDRMIANRVVVRKKATIVAPTPQVVEERSTTTTTTTRKKND